VTVCNLVYSNILICIGILKRVVAGGGSNSKRRSQVESITALVGYLARSEYTKSTLSAKTNFHCGDRIVFTVEKALQRSQKRCRTSGPVPFACLSLAFPRTENDLIAAVFGRSRCHVFDVDPYSVFTLFFYDYKKEGLKLVSKLRDSLTNNSTSRLRCMDLTLRSFVWRWVSMLERKSLCEFPQLQVPRILLIVLPLPQQNCHSGPRRVAFWCNRPFKGIYLGR
jgi:hypothetical protein